MQSQYSNRGAVNLKCKYSNRVFMHLNFKSIQTFCLMSCTGHFFYSKSTDVPLQMQIYDHGYCSYKVM